MSTAIAAALLTLPCQVGCWQVRQGEGGYIAKRSTGQSTPLAAAAVGRPGTQRRQGQRRREASEFEGGPSGNHTPPGGYWEFFPRCLLAGSLLHLNRVWSAPRQRLVHRGRLHLAIRQTQPSEAQLVAPHAQDGLAATAIGTCLPTASDLQTTPAGAPVTQAHRAAAPIAPRNHHPVRGTAIPQQPARLRAGSPSSSRAALALHQVRCGAVRCCPRDPTARTTADRALPPRGDRRTRGTRGRARSCCRTARARVAPAHRRPQRPAVLAAVAARRPRLLSLPVSQLCLGQVRCALNSVLV